MLLKILNLLHGVQLTRNFVRRSGSRAKGVPPRLPSLQKETIRCQLEQRNEIPHRSDDRIRQRDSRHSSTGDRSRGNAAPV